MSQSLIHHTSFFPTLALDFSDHFANAAESSKKQVSVHTFPRENTELSFQFGELVCGFHRLLLVRFKQAADFSDHFANAAESSKKTGERAPIPKNGKNKRTLTLKKRRGHRKSG